MSTKIYNGLIATDPTDDVFSLIQKIRPVVTAHFRELSLGVIARTYAELAEDPETREEVHPNRYLWRIADQRWQKQQRDLDPHQRHGVPLARHSRAALGYWHGPGNARDHRPGQTR